MRTIVCSLLVSLTLSAAAQEGRVFMHGSRVQLTGVPEARVITLLVGGEGVSLRTTFERATSFDLPTRDAGGTPLPDGIYRYEITLWPKGAAAEPLRFDGRYRITLGVVAPATASPLDGVKPNTVTGDELIIQNRLCAGGGCAIVEGWIDEDVQVSSPYPWVRFDDTSSAPNHDWQLIIGDKPTTQNGIERFSIQDLTAGTIPFTIEGSAPTNSLYVTEDGEVGIGTSIPTSTLEVSNNIELGNYPYYDWQLNAGAWFSIGFNQSDTFKYPFTIEDAPEDSLRIRFNGDVGIGTSAPTEQLHVFEDENVNSILMIENPNAGNTAVAVLRAKSNAAIVNFQAHGSGRTISRFGTTLGSWNEFLSVSGNGLLIGTLASVPMILGTNATNRVTILGNGNVGIGTAAPAHPLHMASGAHVTAGGTWTNASSRDLKTNIHELSAEDADAALRALRPVTFEYKAEPGEPYAGFIAEDVPELVATNDRTSLSPMDLVAVLTRVTQEQRERLDQQQKTIDELAAELRALRELVTKSAQ